jgi:ornithine cyclodeaminase/alanine dehydrogenase-like protein (mu-crystallin family)
VQIMNFLYLSRAAVESLNLSMSQIIAVVEEGFRRKGLGETEMPPKTPIHPGGDKNFLHAMPAYVKGVEAASVKWVGGAPDNYQFGLPTITGLLILNDPVTMLPLAVMDCTWLTAMRTAAANAVAMKYLGPKEVREVGLIGCGVQGRSNLLAIQTLYPGVQRVRAYDLNDGVLQSFLREMRQSTGLNIEAVAGPEPAVRGADIVVTAGFMPPKPAPYIEDEWLKPGAMAAPVDYNCAFKSDLCQKMDKLVTDDVAQMDYYRPKGYFEGVPVPWELGEVVAGKQPGRERDDERTMAMCLGIGIDDAVTAKLIYETAREQGVGVELPL